MLEMHSLYKAIRYFERNLSVCFLNGKVYRKKYFYNFGEKTLYDKGLFEQYEQLISRYPDQDNSRKAFQNIGFFIEMIYRMRLIKKENIRILDIGSRAGLFPFFCQSLGHRAIASDLKEVIELSPTREILNLLEVEAIPLKIEPFKVLPVTSERFDLITGLRTRFHSRYTFETGMETDDHWREEEWKFFLKDISSNYLKPDGQIYFVLNRLQDRGQNEKFPPELRKLFHDLGGRQRYNELIFDNSTLQERI